MPMRKKREKVFGPGRAVPQDRNARARIKAHIVAWNQRHRQKGQHKGPITRVIMNVMNALLFGFLNERDGRCFPAYEAIAKKAECSRSMIAPALRVLELTSVFAVQNRITRIRVRELDLFGHWVSRWRVVRTSNAYVFTDPLRPMHSVPASKAENQPGPVQQASYIQKATNPTDPDTPLERALAASAASLHAPVTISDTARGPVAT